MAESLVDNSGVPSMQPTELNYGPTLLDQPQLPIPTSPDTPVSTGGAGPLEDIYASFSNKIKQDAQAVNYYSAAAPVPFNAEATLFDKYESTNHGMMSGLFSDFKEKGFIPWRDNDDTYNQDTNVIKELYRSTKWAAPLLGEGFTSGLRTMPDLLAGIFTGDWDKFFSTDDYLAEKWSRATKMGGSTAGGVSTFLTNMEISAANMVGTIAEMAAEDYILGAVVAGSGGTAAPGAITYAGLKLGKAFKNIYNGFRDVSKVSDVLKDANSARRLFEVTGKGAAAFGKTALETLNPLRQSVEFANDVYKGADYLKDMTGIGKAVTGFGSFYRDVREINFALTESKLEGGFSYIEQRDELVDSYKRQYGKLPVGEEMQKIELNARDAGDFTTKANLATIYLSNRLGFGNMFKGFTPLNKMMSEATNTGALKYVSFNNTKKIFESTTQFSAKNAFRKSIGTSLNYFSANLSEGIQENLQDVISGAAKDYYKKKYDNPAYGGHSLMMADIANQFGPRVFSAQGAETFASGFLMGSVIGGSKSAFSKINDLSYRYFQPEKYAELKQRREQTVNDYVSKLNETYKDVLKYLDPQVADASVQGTLNQYMVQAVSNKDKKEFYDIKDQAVYNHLMTMVRSGKVDVFKDRLEEFKQLKPEEFKEALGFEIDNPELFNQYIDEKIKQVDHIQNLYDKSSEKFRNPVNLSLFKKDTADYDNAALDFMAYENAREQAIFQNYAFMRNTERMAGMLDEMKSTKVLAKSNYLDLSILTNEELTINEIKVLSEEIAGLEKGDQQSKDLAEVKKKRLQALLKWKTAYDAGNTVSEKTGKKVNDRSDDNSEYDGWRNQMKSAFSEFIEVEASAQKDTVFQEGVDQNFETILDYAKLNDESAVLVKATNLLADPKNFLALYDEHSRYIREMYQKREQNIAEAIKKALSVTDENTLITKLAKYGYVEDPNEPGKYLKFDAKGTVPVEVGSEDYKKVQDIIKDHNEFTEKEKRKAEEEARKKAEEQKKQADKKEKDEIEDVEAEPGKVTKVNPKQDYINPVHGVNPVEFEVKTVRDSAGNVRYFEWNIEGKTDKTRETSFTSLAEMERYLELVAFKDYIGKLINGKFKDDVSYSKSGKGFIATFNKPFIETEFPIDIKLSEDEIEFILGEPFKYEDPTPKEDIDDYKEIRVAALQLVDSQVEKTISDLKKKGLTQKNNSGDRFIESVQNPVTVAGFSKEEKQTLRSVVMNLTPEEFSKGVTIKLNRVAEKQQIVKDGNIKVFRNTLSVSAEVWYDGKIVGYLTYPDVYTFEINGVPKTVEELTNADYSAIAKDSAGTLDQFKANNKISRDVYNQLVQLLSDKESLELSNSQVNDIVGFETRMGSYEFTNTLRPLTDLEKEGVKLIGVYDKVNDDKQVAGNTLSEEQQQNFSKVDASLSDIKTKTAEMGRYIAVYEHPNGQLSYVEVKTSKYGEDDLAELFTNLSDRLELTRQQNVKLEDNGRGGKVPRAVDNGFNKAYNGDLSKNIFIAFDPTENGVRGVYAALSITADGQIKVQFTDNNNKKNFDIFVPLEYNTDGTLKTVKGLDRLLREINMKITDYNTVNGTTLPVFTKDVFRQSVPRVSDFDKLKSLNTNVGENIRLSPQMYFYSKQAAKPEGSTVNPIAKNKQAKPSSKNTDIPTASVSDIKRDRYRNRQANRMVKMQKDSANTDLTEEDIDDIEAVIEKAKELGWDKNKLFRKLNAMGYTYALGNEVEAFRNYLEDRLSGKTNIKVTSEYNFFKQLDAELADIEEEIVEVKTQPERKKRSLGGNFSLKERSTTETVAKEDAADDASPTDKSAPKINDFDKIKQEYSEKQSELKRQKDSGKISAVEYANAKRKLEQDESSALKKLAGKTAPRTLKRSKIGTEEFGTADMEKIEVFANWVAKSLPDVFTVEEIYLMAEKISHNKVRMGRFMAYINDVNKGLSGIRGKIQVGDRYRYHEAFHAVFQLLLTDDQIERTLRVAEYEFNQSIKGKKTMSQALSEFRELYKEEYADLSDAELKERMLEEYLADKFDEFKNGKNRTNPKSTDNIISQVYRKIKEFIKRLINGKSDIYDLFDHIDSGKFKNTNIQSNRFTDQLIEGAPVIEAFKVKYGENVQKGLNGNLVVIDKYLSESDTQKLVGAIVNSYIYREQKLRQDKSKDMTRDQLLNEIIDSFRKLYTIDNRYNDLDSSKLDRLFVFDELFNGGMSETAVQGLKESAVVYLDLMGYQSDFESDEAELIVDDLGDRRSTESYEESFSKGGLKSLSGFTRRYIQSTAYQQADEFGNDILDEETGEPLTSGVNSGVIYNGLVKIMAGVTSEDKFIRRLYHFMDENQETKAFIEKFINDTGLTFNPETGEYSVNTNPQLFMSVFKSFTLFQTDYTTMLIDPNNKTMRWFKTNKKDAASNQYNRWQWRFMANYQDMLAIEPQLKDELIKVFDGLMLPFGNSAVTDQDLTTFVDQRLKDLHRITGIKISSKYFKYSVIAHLAGKNQELTPAQKDLYNSFDEVTPITREDLLEIRNTINKGKNPFLNFEGSLSVQEEEDRTGVDPREEDYEEVSDGDVTDQADMSKVGNQGRLITMAANNAIFDETVLATSWQNAAGKTVYAHQFPTFHLAYVNDVIKDASALRQLVENDPYLQDTFLGKQIMEGKGVASILKDLNIVRIDGLRQIVGSIINGKLVENKRTKANKREGIVYGDYGTQEFLISTLHLYLHNKKISLPDNSSVVTSRHLIRVLEASSTGDTINLPVIQSVYTSGNKIKLTEKAREHFFDEFLSEYNRIGRVQQQISSGEFPDGVIEDYHNGKLRGLQFRSFKDLLGPLVDQLTAQAKSGELITDAQKEEILNQIEDKILGENGLVNDLINIMVDSKILSKDEATGKITNNMLAQEIFGYDEDKDKTLRLDTELNLKRGKLNHNISQIFVNDFLNTMSFNKLLLGDQAMGLKDFIDAVKRAKGANGSGYNLRSEILAPQYGIDHKFTNFYVTTHENPEYEGRFSGKKQDRADAQMWGTVKGFRYIMHSLGRLDQKVSDFLDKIERGEKLEVNDVFYNGGSISFNGQTSVLKVVYYDGKSYIKTSMFVLSKRYTSRLKDDVALKVAELKSKRNSLDDSRVAAALKINREIDNLLRDNANYLPQLGMEVLHNKRLNLEKFESAGRVSFSIPKSASKGIKKNISTDLEKFEVADAEYTKLDNKYFRLQVENPTNKTKITDPTQARQIIDTEQGDNVKVDYFGNEITVGELRRLYQESTASRVSLKYIEARNKIFTLDGLTRELQTSISTNQITPKLAEFQKHALKILESMGADGQLYDFFKVDEDPSTGVLKPKYDLNHPRTRTKYVQLFLAYFRNDVMSEKVPGHALTLVSDFGVKKIKRVTHVKNINGKNVPIAWEVVRQEEYLNNPSKYESKVAEFKENLEDHDLNVGDYFLDDLRFNVQEVDDKGNYIPNKYYSECMFAPHFAEFMKLDSSKPIPPAISKAFGVRIPSDDKHSFISLKLVDFLPANYGSSGVFPKELIEISGADFDVDKLYTQITDHYFVKDEKGFFVPRAYGHETSLEGRHFEFITWNLKNNKDLKRKRKELGAIKDFDDLHLYDLKTAKGDITDAKELFDVITKDDRFKFIEETAFRESGLPYTLQEFKAYLKKYSAYQDVNIGALNNKILEAKQLLLTNESQKKLSTEVVSLDPLEKLLNDPRLKPGIIEEKNIDPDHLAGKTEAFKNNQEGQKNIGPAVNGMLSYTLLNKFKIQFKESVYKFTVDGLSFDGYNQNKIAELEKVDGKDKIKSVNGKIQYSGKRIFNNITAIVNAMTDNAKERLAAKLNLNIEAVSVATDLTARGVPLEIIEAILLNPAVKEYYKEIRSSKNGIRLQYKSRKEIREQVLNKYKSELGDGEVLPLTTEMLFEGVKGNSAAINYTVLVNFLEIEKQSEYFSEIAQIMKLSKGLGTDFEYWDGIKESLETLGIGMKDDEFKESEIPFDIREVVKKKHIITATYLNIAKQLDELEKTMFIERTDLFQKVMTSITDQFDVKPVDYKKFKAATRNNLVVFIGLKGFLKKLQDENAEVLSMLDNRLIYDGDPEFDGIIPILKLASSQAKSNYLLNNFLNTVPMTVLQDGKPIKNENNSKGINAVESNTWGKLDSYQLEKLQNSFSELYSSDNINLRRAALALFAYTIVKDGTQYKSNGLMSVIPPYMYEDLFAEVMPNVREIFSEDKLVEALKEDSAYLQDFRGVFGQDFKSMVAEFMKVYMGHVSNQFYLKRISPPKGTVKKIEITKLSESLFSELKLNNELTFSTTLKLEPGYHNILQIKGGDRINNVVLTKVGEVKSENEKTVYTYEAVVDDLVDERPKGAFSITDDNSLVHINIFRNIKDFTLVDTFNPEEDKYVKELVENDNKGSLNPSEKERFKQNIAGLKKIGFIVTQDKETDHIVVNLPYRFKMKGSDKRDMYFELALMGKVRSDKKDFEQVNLKDIFDDDFKFKASMATYRRVEPEGSYSTATIGGMFGTIPEYKAYTQKALGYTEEERNKLAEGFGEINTISKQNEEWKEMYGDSVETEPKTSSNEKESNTPDQPWVVGSQQFSQTNETPEVDNRTVKEKLKAFGYTYRMDNKLGKIVYKKDKKAFTFEGTPQQLFDSLHVDNTISAESKKDTITTAESPKPKRTLGKGFSLKSRATTELVSKEEVNDVLNELDCKRSKK